MQILEQRNIEAKDSETSLKDRIFTPNLIVVAACFIIALSGFAYILAKLPGLINISSTSSQTCISGGWKFGLIATHILTFALIPLAMRVFYKSLIILKWSSKAIFASQLGLSFIMVAIAAEIGWHVTQCWYYENGFTMLNFMFYFFLISAFALWADGLVKKTTALTNLVNVFFAVSLLGISILYYLGYVHESNTSYKTPIYILLTLVFGVLTYRGYKLLKTWKILLFPLFSVGVNLSFVFLLEKFGQDNVTYNALFHILHDLGGTEAGVAIFTWLVYAEALAKQNEEQSLIGN
ncbi:hypothetical protein [Calothrix sp. CCY 0018]|uniref:hypothetical protein n=1 Tax=Calothrix sp. CCY 0018 TaxID=3103864 RepID=UPI0039C709F7